MRRPDSVSLSLLAQAMAVLAGCWGFAGLVQADDGIEFFERKIRPVLIEHCYKCHSDDSTELKGELRLDLKAGWQKGGESGEPSIIPGKPEESPLILAVRHTDDSSAMPPNQPRLAATVIDDLTAWVKMGAPDPRVGEIKPRDPNAAWEKEYQQRLQWWSLQPVARPVPPEVNHRHWSRTEVDKFVLAQLVAEKLTPVPEADRRTLVRRLSFALTGLPPASALVERFAADDSPQAYDNLVTQLLDSPHFGERWARHWMDVVHYSDTHGYEWDVPAKNAWRYRDYLIRAFNADLPYRQLLLEQLAGDLIPARIDPATGIDETLIAPMMLRLGERRHGDSAGAEGVAQEAVSNMIDTLGKGFLGTTLACAQCHDHKLDAVEQRDYYALAGVLMSTRFSVRPLDTVDQNQPVIEELRAIKRQLREELAKLWLAATDPTQADGAAEKLRAIAADEKPAAALPTSLAGFWKRSLNSPVTADEFNQERQRRIAANQANLTLLADFTREDGAAGWRWEGSGMKHGLVASGEIVISHEGNLALEQLLPAGRFSHTWSQRLAGSLQSPLFDPTQPVTFSIQVAAGKFASQSFIVDQALNSERLKFMNQPSPGWLTLTAGAFSSLEGTPDRAARTVYFEMATKALNNYFPPRTGYEGSSEAEENDPRSWFGVTRVFRHAPGQTPQDELGRFGPLFAELQPEADWSQRLTRLLRASIERWSRGECSDEDVLLLNDALQLKLLPNEQVEHTKLPQLVAQYRAIEQKLQPDHTVGSVADWNEGHDQRIGIRGSYTELGDLVHRGAPRFLRNMSFLTPQAPSASNKRMGSGRLELAEYFVDPRNPLTARVYVNRVWHYLFGAGLVRTPDDFGHLGEQPSHPELLDYLATRFVEEGWSTKKLIRLLVTSAVWRQGSVPTAAALQLDPENRLWHHRPMRRLEAEAIRDSILAVSGRLDESLFGLAIEPSRAAVDPQKRLFQGPLDGNGRRSIYLEMTLMEPPRFLALFNQPIPKQTVGRRDITNVPDQALALLNDPFVIAMAKHWSERLMTDAAKTPEERAGQMLFAALARPAESAEIAGLVQLVRQTAELRGAGGDLLACQPAWQDAAHAIFNLKEFLYVR